MPLSSRTTCADSLPRWTTAIFETSTQHFGKATPFEDKSEAYPKGASCRFAASSVPSPLCYSALS